MSHFKTKGIAQIKEKLNRSQIGLWAWMGLGFITVYLGQRRFWTDSEMWAVSATRDFFSGRPDFLFSVKPGFHFLLWANFKLSEWFGFFPMDFSRFIWSLFGISTLLMLDQILKAYQLSAKVRLLWILFLLSLSTWVFRSSEVRSDLLVTLIVLVSLYRVAIHCAYSKWFLIVGFLLSMLITPKAVFAWIAVSPWLTSKIKIKWGRNFSIFSAFFLLICAAIFLINLNGFLSAWDYFLKNFDSKEIGFEYWSWYRLEHILRLHWQNIYFSVVFLGSLVAGIYYRNWRAVAAIGLLFLITHGFPDPLPFFIASFLPFFILSFALASQPVIGGFKSSVVTGLCVVFLILTLFRFLQINTHTNIEQRQLVKWGETYLKNTQMSVFDPTGLLTSERAVHWFLGPGMRAGYAEVMKAIKDQKIDVILYTSKLGYLEPEIHRLFEKDYLQLSSSIFVRAYSLSEELPCKEIYKNLLERFPRNKELNIPLYVWGRELYSEEFFEIDLNLEKICQRQFSQEMHYHFMSSRIGRVPAVDLRRLFNYDTAF